MTKMSNVIDRQLNDIYSKYGSYKIVFGLTVRMYSEKLGVEKDKHFHSGFSHFNDNTTLGATIITNEQNLKHFFAAITVISKKIEDFQKTTSDWVIINIVKMILKIAKYKPASGSSYFPLPEYISLKKCCINIQNEKNRCFEYSVLCGLHHTEIKKNLFRPSLYKSYLDKLKFDGIELLVQVDDVSNFETMNELPINVFGLDDNENITVLHAHTFKSENQLLIYF